MPFLYPEPILWWCREQVENLVMIELAYINTKHPDFRSDASIVSSLMSAAGLDEEKQRNVPARRQIQQQNYEQEGRVSEQTHIYNRFIL